MPAGDREGPLAPARGEGRPRVDDPLRVPGLLQADLGDHAVAGHAFGGQAQEILPRRLDRAGRQIDNLRQQVLFADQEELPDELAGLARAAGVAAELGQRALVTVAARLAGTSARVEGIAVRRAP